MRAFSYSVVAVVLAVCLTARVQAGDHDIRYGRHNINMGQRAPRDVLLFHDVLDIPSKFMRVQSVDACYPPRGQPSRITITAFNVTDKMPSGDGGYAFVDAGGIGSSSVCFHLKTQRGEGYNFVIDIYGFHV